MPTEVAVHDYSIVVQQTEQLVQVDQNQTAITVNLVDNVVQVEVGSPGSGSTSGGSGHTIQDEGVALTQRSTMNFVGAGVTASDSGGVTQINVPGGADFVGTFKWGVD
jgi:hypothetical protein